jgi:hypothetical protein
VNSRRKRIVFVGIGASVLIVLVALWFIDKFVTEIRISFANDQTSIFEDMRAKAVAATDIREAVDCLRYILNYYPSGTKQLAGSKLDQIVERARRSALREIIANLRDRSDQDFGDDPQRWIEGLREAKEL